MTIRIFPADIDWIVALVNEYSQATRAAAGLDDKPYPDVAILGEAPLMASRLSEEDLVELADRLFAVFNADSGARRVELLDAMLTQSRPVPHLELDDSRHIVAWEVEDRRSAVQAAGALAVVDLLVGDDESAAPLGTCDAKDCTDVFVDRSRAGIRLYCSSTCQTRTKVAAFRARRRAQS